MLKKRAFSPIFAQKVRNFANFLSLFEHFLQFFTTFFLVILPELSKLNHPPLILLLKLTLPSKTAKI